MPLCSIADGQILADLSPAELFTHPDILAKRLTQRDFDFALANRLGMDPYANAVFMQQME